MLLGRFFLLLMPELFVCKESKTKEYFSDAGCYGYSSFQCLNLGLCWKDCNGMFRKVQDTLSRLILSALGLSFGAFFLLPVKSTYVLEGQSLAAWSRYEVWISGFSCFGWCSSGW